MIFMIGLWELWIADWRMENADLAGRLEFQINDCGLVIDNCDWNQGLIFSI